MKTALVALVDIMGVKAGGPDEFRGWTDRLLPGLDAFEAEAHREFVHRRVEDWMLHLSVKDGHVPTPDELAEATNWMQRLLAEESASRAVLTLIAESGTTRKTRNIAKNRAGTAK